MVKTNYLSGAALDWAVAKCEGIALIDGCYNRLLIDGRMSRGQSMLAPYKPSTVWTDGGPIIEHERIELWFDRFDDIDSALALWGARKFNDGIVAYGFAPLIAAMRCYVASQLGDEIEVPSDLNNQLDLTYVPKRTPK